MRLIAIEHLCHSLALIGSERRDVDQRLNSFVGRPGDYSPCVCVARQNYWAAGSFQRVIYSGDVVRERGQRNLGTDHLKTVPLQRENEVAPTRPVGPCAMHQNDCAVLRKRVHLPSPLFPLRCTISLALRNSLIAEATSTTCVSSAKCPVSRN